MIYDAVLTVAAILAIWVAARRWSAAYVARYGRPPATGWMLSRVDDPQLERDRRVFLVIVAVSVAIAVRLVWRLLNA